MCIRATAFIIHLLPQAFENTLKSWEDKLRYDSCRPALRPHLYPQQSVDLATEEEVTQLQLCAQAAEELITRYVTARSLSFQQARGQVAIEEC